MQVFAARSASAPYQRAADVAKASPPLHNAVDQNASFKSRMRFVLLSWPSRSEGFSCPAKAGFRVTGPAGNRRLEWRGGV